MLIRPLKIYVNHIHALYFGNIKKNNNNKIKNCRDL